MFKKLIHPLLKHPNISLFILFLYCTGILSGILFTKYIQIPFVQFIFDDSLSLINTTQEYTNFFISQFTTQLLQFLVLGICGSSIFGPVLIGFFTYTKGIQIVFSIVNAYFGNVRNFKAFLFLLLSEITLDFFAYFLIALISIQFSYSMILQLFYTKLPRKKNNEKEFLFYIKIAIMMTLLSSLLKTICFLPLFQRFTR